MENVEGKWALITGSSRGIGQQIALGLARRGVNIVVHGRTEQSCETTASMVKKEGVQVAVAAAPLNGESGAQSVVEQSLKVAPQIDILYSNAGVQNQWKEIWDITAAEWRDTFQINFFSVVTIGNGLIPQMIKKGYGRVIVTTSGIPDIPQLSPYGASKAAVDKYVFDMSAQLKDTGVEIFALDPGWLRTDLGGPDGMFAVEDVLPGALVPVITSGVIESGTMYRAQNYRGM